MTNHEVTAERRLDAPIEDVWAMWTDPEHFPGATGWSMASDKLDAHLSARYPELAAELSGALH